MTSSSIAIRPTFVLLSLLVSATVAPLSGCATGHRFVVCAEGTQDNDHDEVCSPVCEDTTCNSHGSCSDASGTAVCTCTGGYVGTDCAACGAGLQDRDGDGVCAEACTASTCNSHGSCDDSSGAAVCTCAGGYIGADCAMCDVGMQDNDGDGVCTGTCVADSCSGHGACDDSSGSAICTCSGGYVGTNCSTCDVGLQDNNDNGICTAGCTLTTCSGHGSCDDTTTDVATCTCSGNYVGADCSTCDVGLQDNNGNGLCTAACTLTTCSGHGTCDDTTTDVATCTCSGNYVGADCSTCDVGLQDNNGNGICTAACTLTTCSGHGTCDDTTTDVATCTCSGNYVGADCSTCDVGLQDNNGNGLCTAACTPTTCSGHGTCDDTTTDVATCACSGNYVGADCSTCDVGLQDNNGNGTCTPGCTLTTCSGYGSCDDTTTDVATCTCTDHHDGADCSGCATGYADLDTNGSCTATCAITDCGRNQVCTDTAAGATCACAAHYRGTSCEYRQVYALTIPASADWNTLAQVTYSYDASAEVAAFDRVAYDYNLDAKNVWASMDAFTDVANQTGVPVDSTFEQTVQNLTVTTNVAGVANVTNASDGRIEFWSHCYSFEPGAWSTDDYIEENRPDCYGSMQLHAGTSTVFAYNRWSQGATADVGIGNQGAVDTDWTFTGNAATYTTRTMDVYVRELATCDSSTCNGHGTCSDVTGLAVCACDAGRTGLRCGQCASGYEDDDHDGVCALACDGGSCNKLSDARGKASGLHTFRLLSGDVPLYVDSSYDGGGWILIGRGRQDWDWLEEGRGVAADVGATVGTSAAFTPAYLHADLVNGLIASEGIDLRNTQVRIRRATNNAGSSWQEVSWAFSAETSWRWQLDLWAASVSQTVATSTLGTGATATGTTTTAGSNNHTRVWTSQYVPHDDRKGFSYGSTVTIGSNLSTDFLWEYANENYAIPYTEVYIRRPLCTASTCSGFGTCSEATGVAVCTCSVGHTGANCASCATGYQDNDTNGSCFASCSLAGACCGAGSSCTDISGTAVCGACGSGSQDNDANGSCAPTCATAGVSCTADAACSDASGTAVCVCLADADGDGVCDSVDTCAGSDRDTDGDGVYDGCDYDANNPLLGIAEVCDGIDNDGNGSVDDGLTRTCHLVNTLLDTSDANPGDGFALDASGNVSLRAVLEENAVLATPRSIYLAAGTYTLTTATTLVATGSIEIRGAGASTTTIAANSATTAISAGTGVSLSLVGVTVSGAGTSGVLCTNCSSFSLRNGTLTTNGGSATGQQGGGFRVSTSTSTVVSIDGSTISSNSASQGGGAYIAATSGAFLTLNITSSVVKTNKGYSTSAANYQGIGVVSSSGATIQAYVADSTFLSNKQASHFGGALGFAGGATSGTVTVVGCTFDSNSNGRGAGSYFEFTSGLWDIDILDSAYVRNSGTEGTGFYLSSGSSATVDALVRNVTVASNTGGAGAISVRVAKGAVRFEHDTITANAVGGIGGIDITSQASAALTITFANTILAGNTGTVRDIRRQTNATLVSAGGNVFGTPLSDSGTFSAFTLQSTDIVGTSASPLDPQLAALVENGLVPPYRMPNCASTAIDRGGASTTSYDLRGAPRSIDGNVDGASAPDSGAVEYGCSGTDSDSDGVPDACDSSAGLCATKPCSVGLGCYVSGRSYVCQ